MLATVYAAFHFATLEEYYVGGLFMPPCNGSSDGSFVFILAYLVTGIFGNGFWSIGVLNGEWTHIKGLEILTVAHLVCIFVIVSQTIVWICNFVRIIRSKSKPMAT